MVVKILGSLREACWKRSVDWVSFMVRLDNYSYLPVFYLFFEGISIHVHVTPYQVQDDHRPWIRKEEKAFTDLLKRLGCTLTRHLHSSESTCSNLFTHFEVLENFRIHQVHQIQLQIQQQLAQEKQQLNDENDGDQIMQKNPVSTETNNDKDAEVAET